MLIVETNTVTAATAIVGLIVWKVFPVSEQFHLRGYCVPLSLPFLGWKSFHDTVSDFENLFIGANWSEELARLESCESRSIL